MKDDQLSVNAETTGRRSVSWFWTLVSVTLLLYTYAFSVRAPLGWWPNYLLGHEMWLDNDPGGWYLPSAHQLFATRGHLVFAGHPGLPMQILFQVQQKLYFWICGSGSGLSFTEFTARHVPAVALGARLIATVTHLLSFYALFVFSRLVTGDVRAAFLSVLGYATSLPALYYISRISVEPWMILFYLCTFIFFWKFQSCMESGSRRRGHLWISLASFSAVSAAFTKLHLVGPLPVFALGMVVVAVVRRAISGSVTWRAGSAFLATYALSAGISVLAYDAVMDWSSFFSVWNQFLPESGHDHTTILGLANKLLAVFTLLWNALAQFSWSRLLPSPARRDLFFYFEAYFLCVAAFGIVLMLKKGPRGKALAAWALLYSAFPVCMWIFRFQFHYLFTVVATLAVFFGYVMSEAIERLRRKPLGLAEWAIMLTAVFLLHGSGIRAVVESRIHDLESAKMQHSDLVARSLSQLAAGERLGVIGELDPYFHGLSASYARGVRSSLMEEVRRLYVRLPDTFDPQTLDNPSFVSSHGRIGLILDLRVPDPRPVEAEAWTPPATGTIVEMPDESVRRHQVLGRELVDADGRRWRGNDEAEFRAASVVLRPGGALFEVLPTGELAGQHFLLQAEARSLEDLRGVLRIQAVWLPEGGWQATDAAGEPVRQIQSSRAYTGHAAETHACEISRPGMAVRLAMTFRNDGDVPLEVLQVRLVAIDRQDGGGS